MNNCANCGNQLAKYQMKFCSIKCSVSYSNRTRVRPHQNQLKIRLCKKCKSDINRRDWKDNRFLCEECSDKSKTDLYRIGELKDFKRVISENARRVYYKSNKPKHCVVCGYDKHFDVCHVKAIKEFPPNAVVSEVNCIDNLVALCKNHHWEFDSGLITLG